MRNTIRLTESQFNSLIKESVKMVLKESFYQSCDTECCLYFDIQFPKYLGGKLVKDVCIVANVTYNPEEPERYNRKGCSASYDVTDIEFGEEYCDFYLSEKQIDYINKEWIEENWNEISEKAKEVAIDEFKSIYDYRQDEYDNYLKTQIDAENDEIF